MEIGGAGDGIDPVGREWLSGDGIRQLSTKASVAKGPGAGESFPDSGRADRSGCGERHGAKLAKGGAKGMGSGPHGIAVVRPIRAPDPFDSATSDDPARRSVFESSWRALRLGARPLVRSAGWRRASASAEIPVPSLQCPTKCYFPVFRLAPRYRHRDGRDAAHALSTGRCGQGSHGAASRPGR